MPQPKRARFKIDLCTPEILIWDIPHGLLGADVCPFRVTVTDTMEWLEVRTAGTDDSGPPVFKVGASTAGMTRADWRSTLAALVDKDRTIRLTCWSDLSGVPEFWTVKASQ